MDLYFDNAATTAIRPEVLEAMMPYLTRNYANPSGVYMSANKIRTTLDESRQIIAQAINANPNEIFFTGGGTEAVNWAIKGIAKCSGNKRHIITTRIEHHAVLNTCKYLQEHGFDITYLPVDSDGIVATDSVIEAIRSDTALISIMMANNEVGTIQPIEAIGAIAKQNGIPFHTDAIQAVGHIPVDVDVLGVDLLALSAHKFNAPKGVGALYVRSGIQLSPILHGGYQEKGKRAGTENVASIVGMAVGLDISIREMKREYIRQTALRDKLINGILTNIPQSSLNGHSIKRLPSNVNISFRHIEGELLLLHLDVRGCSVSTGSACLATSLEPSHVLTAMGLPNEQIYSAVRITLGYFNTESDVDKLLEILIATVSKLRKCGD